MKIYLSYSHEDKTRVNKVMAALKSSNYSMIEVKSKFDESTNVIRAIAQELLKADVVLVFFSNASLNSSFTMKEMNTIAMLEITSNDIVIIPILLDNVTVPSYFANYQFFNMAKDFNNGLGRLLVALELIRKGKETTKVHMPHVKEVIEGLRKKKTEEKKLLLQNREHHIQYLSKELYDGRLTLICGAGISVGAGVLTWDDLLVRLLGLVTERLAKDKSDFKSVDMEEFKKVYAPSALVIGKYLKNNLGDSFYEEVRDALYMNNPVTCDAVKSIVELARPKRDGKPLDSIITFNFDSLIEENLMAQNINYSSIYKEGMRTKASELPIYHVHGYLPKTGKITKECGMVFSEDTYHSQFIEPFSWSNLVQLNKLSQNTCLLVGLSMTDPNLRRILDVANRKNDEKSLNHYLLKKIPSETENYTPNDELARFLEEQDANTLGINVIWIDDFNEIPELLQKINSKQQY